MSSKCSMSCSSMPSRNMLHVSRCWTRNQGRLYSYSSSITILNRPWWKSIYGEPFQLWGSSMTLSNIHMDCFSMRKSSDTVAASWSPGSATGLWRVCRRGVNRPSFDGLTNQNKSIWSKIFAILPARHKDMRPTI
jgi:hypothetical protein